MAKKDKNKKAELPVDPEVEKRLKEKAERGRIAFRKKNGLLTLEEKITIKQKEIDQQLDNGNITEDEAADIMERYIEAETAKEEKRTPSTKAEAIANGKKVVKSVPFNFFDPEKWPKPQFVSRSLKPVKNEDGTVSYVDGGRVVTDFPVYERDSYCYKRVFKEMELQPQDNMIACVGENRGWGKIFSSDEEDNIEILFYTLDRCLIELDRTDRMGTTEQMSDNKKFGGWYKRVRLNPENEKKAGHKYKSPTKQQSKTTYPFIPPQIVRKWELREKIQTLVVTEGEFKAFKACMCGADVVAICGITMIKDSETLDVYPDLLRIIQDCEVENVVLLHDGDCTDLSDDALESKDCNGQPDKDLTKRPHMFMSAAKNFYNLYHKAAPKVNIYWSYVNTEAIPGHPKGLDDLLIYHKDKQAQIVRELQDVDSITAFYKRVNMNHERNRLSEHFYLDSVKNFYNHHKAKIDPPSEAGNMRGYRPFLFCGTIYKWNDQKHECEEILSRDMMAYMRIGTGWFKLTRVPTKGKDADNHYIYAETLAPWSRQNITDDYGTEVLKKLHKYDGFINFPDHENYMRVIGNFYNMYHPLLYKPSAEELRSKGFPVIYSTLEHIFGKDNRGRGLKPGDEGYDPQSQFDTGVDYIELMYKNPRQNLPILCLVSNERGTGKTSLLDLLQVLFAENTVIVGNEQMTSKFNTLIAGRLCVGVDESNLADNKAFTEKLKYWSTAKRLPMEGKGKDATMVDNFTKYILCSNNETRFIYASDEEVRFWVRKVPQFAEGEKIGSVKPFFEEEMPAFMAWLNQRELFYNPDDPKKIDRMYFPPEMLRTEWLNNLLEAQRPRAERKMREWLKQWFIDFGKLELLTTADKLQEAISITDKKFNNFDLEDIKRYIEENMHVKKFGGGSGKSKRFHFQIVSSFVPDDQKEDELTVNKVTIAGNGRPYQFFAKDFLTEAEFYDTFPDERPKTEQKKIDFPEPTEEQPYSDAELDLYEEQLLAENDIY